jgi:FkbM family methyltransferase
MYDWITEYNFNGDCRLGVKIDSIVSSNDGDVAIAAAMEELLHRIPTAYCLDIGADEGWWSLFARNKSQQAEIVAFEPNPLSYKKLIENTKNKNIKLINKAVSEKEGYLMFELSEGCTNSREENSSNNLIKLECTPITQYIEGKKNSIVKIDTEGHDIIILKTLLPYLENIDTLIFEFTIYWYKNKNEALDVLITLQKNYKHMYLLNRRGFPKFNEVPKTADLYNLLYQFYVNKYQVDIICTNTPFTTIPVV